MKTVRYFLLALTLTACASTQLGAMKRQNQLSRIWDFLSAFGSELADRVPDNHFPQTSPISLPQTYHQILEMFTKASRGSALPELARYILAFQLALDGPIAFVQRLTQEEIGSLFKTLQEESVLKMALRLVYAKKYRANLDHLDCLDFVFTLRCMAGSGSFRKEKATALFSQNYLQYVLPILESFTGTPVRKLDLNSYQLTELPVSIGNLVKLESLNLGNNKLTALPDSIGNLVNLREFYFYMNQLTKVPDSIGNLVNLKILELHANQVKKLPDSISNLVKLEWLYLANNKLTKLPVSVGNLIALKEFFLENNLFSDDERQLIIEQFRNVEIFRI